jgi:DNA-binding LacI/PurR family transcriptional regulator
MRAVRLQDVADYADVSMKTVSNVVHDYPHVSAAMRERVQRAIDTLGYKPNLLGRRLATGHSGLIALAFIDIGLPYFAELSQAVSRTALDLGYRVLLEETGGTLEGERALLNGTESGLVDGVLFQPSAMTSTQLARARFDLPVVLLGEVDAPLTMDRVMIDNMAAARQITECLIESGHRRIGFVGHERTSLSETSRQRLEGFQMALQRARLTPDPRSLIATDSISSASAVAAVGAALDAGLSCDALVCRDDLAAIGTLRALQSRGLRIPADVAVTGWDDIALSATTFPSLTTVAPDLDALARRALTLLIDRIEGYDGIGRHEIVPHKIVVRESAPESLPNESLLR